MISLNQILQCFKYHEEFIIYGFILELTTHGKYVIIKYDGF